MLFLKFSIINENELFYIHDIDIKDEIEYMFASSNECNYTRRLCMLII
jgi:hypothetical protein